MKAIVVTAIALVVGVLACRFSPAGDPHALPPAQPARHYVCARATEPVQIDGNIEKAVWQNVSWTDDFVDIEGDLKPRPPLRTRAKLLWDDQNLYVAAEITEPHVWATLKHHDAVMFIDNDFELFLNPSCDTQNYYELEMNAFNTVWDLLLRKPYRQGGHGENSFEFAGLSTAVRVRGTLNDSSDTDVGWDVEISIPWTSLNVHTPHPSAPKSGDVWKINFSRVEWDMTWTSGKYVKIPKRPEHNWVWSPMGMIEMHLPERWGTLEFK